MCHFEETVLLTKILLDVDVLRLDFLHISQKRDRFLFDLTTEKKIKKLLDFAEHRKNNNRIQGNNMRILSVFWYQRNIQAETLINAKQKEVPCEYGPHNRPMYGIVIIGEIDPDYSKELIIVR